MKCPIDSNDLQMTERQGIEIDYCPACRGVWLDRGELDKMLDRAGESVPSRPSAPYQGHESPAPHPRMPEQSYDSRRSESGHYPQKKHRKESFMSDLFDF
ncbi:MAG: zf-TFIIB domain-containing protein [Patescibacteria group bacterium]